MSVEKTKRSIPKCIAITKCKDLVKHTLLITNNEKVFTPTYIALTQDIIHCAEKIYINCYSANNVYVNSKDTYHMRIRYQKDAILECENLLALIQLAYELFHLASKRVEYWSNMLINTRETIKSWSKSDTERYKEYR